MPMTSRLKTALVGVGLLAQLPFFAPGALAQDAESEALQIYGLALDETRLGDGFCESCAGRSEALPKVLRMEVQTTPAPYVELVLEPGPTGRPRDVRIWYAPREEDGQSFMITTTSHVDGNLDHARNDVIETFGAPTVEFTHADMEARGIRVADLAVDTLLYVDRALPDTDWARIAHRVRSEFNPTGAELFSLTNTRLRTLARLLGPDFRGAIVQVSESGWSHDSTVTTILLDLTRAQSIFRLAG
ncbi:MAG TPA: hypothetical protein VJV39_11340 [Dongiaceae bacterium]|nr:hypothetical protein [Dongiaceae bacterium]